MHIFLLRQKENKHQSVPNHPKKGEAGIDFKFSDFYFSTEYFATALSLNTLKIQVFSPGLQ